MTQISMSIKETKWQKAWRACDDALRNRGRATATVREFTAVYRPGMDPDITAHKILDIRDHERGPG